MKLSGLWTPEERIEVARACALSIRERWMNRRQYAVPGVPTAESIFVVLTASANSLDVNRRDFQQIIDETQMLGLSKEAKAQVFARGGPGDWIA